MMKKILAYVSPERHTSLFDIIVAYDSGADTVVPYANISKEDIRDIIYSSVFSRHRDDLRNTALFIGGYNVERCEELIDVIRETFNELSDPFRVSVAIDPSGSYTTASACVVKIKNSIHNLYGLNSTILAGTGPIGQIISVLLAKEGCNVTLTSRRIEKARAVSRILERRYKVRVKPFEANNDETITEIVSDSDIVITTAPEGVRVLTKKIWSKFPIRVMADLNVVKPYGIEGINARYDCRKIEGGKIAIGGLAIGNLKMRCHREIVRRLFKEKGVIFSLERVYRIAESIG